MKKHKKLISSICMISILSLTLCTTHCKVKASTNNAVQTSYKVGDVNNDGVINLKDASLIQQYLLGHNVNFTASQKKAADVDFDGTITLKDASTIQRYCVKSINSFYSVNFDTWTSLYKATTKKFSLNFNMPYHISVSYVNDSNWISAKKSGKEFTLTTKQNNSNIMREAVVNIKINDETLSIKVKQLGKNEITSNNKANYNCYSYALQLSSDPRSEAGSSITGLYINPGMLANLSYNIDNYNIINYSINNNAGNMFNDVKNYIINLTNADLKTLGWKIKAVDSAYAKVKDGNWLIALSVNPTEVYSNKNVSATINGNGSIFTDYHWYRRVDSEDGTSYWTHKLGNTAPQKLNVLPENVSDRSHKVCSEVDYLNTYNNYANAFMRQYSANKGHPLKFVYSNVNNNISKEMDMQNRYCFLGYFEVGPNV